MHIQEQVLRAKLDGELPATESAAVERHLAECAACRGLAAGIEERSRRVGDLFAALPADVQPDTKVAYARLRARAVDSPARRSWLDFLPVRRAPAWGGALAAVALVSVLLVSGSARATAQKLLAMFRAKEVVVVPVQSETFTEGRGKPFADFLASSVTFTKEEKAQPAASREEAEKLAGFAVRLPSALSEAPKLTVEGAHSFHFKVDLARAQTLVNTLGRPDLTLPKELDGTKVAVEIPRGVIARYGDCRMRRAAPDEPAISAGGVCTVVSQVPSPTVVTMPEFNIAQVAELGLQLTGMGAEEAHAFSSRVDWSSTLAIPVPPAVATHQEVTIDGAPGVFLTSRAYEGRPSRYAVVWVKNGVIHSVSGFGNSSMAIPVAQSLQ